MTECVIQHPMLFEGFAIESEWNPDNPTVTVIQCSREVFDRIPQLLKEYKQDESVDPDDFYSFALWLKDHHNCTLIESIPFVSQQSLEEDDV